MKVRDLAAAIGAACALTMLSGPASAADPAVYAPPPPLAVEPPAAVSQWYVSIMGGVALPGKLDVSVAPAILPIPVDPPFFAPVDGMRADGRLSFGFGKAFTAAVGTRITDRIRAELLVGYADNPVSKFKGTVQPGDIHLNVPASGKFETFRVMLAGAYDFDLGTPYFRPYLGLGAGVMFLDVKDVRMTIPGAPVMPALNDSATVPAIQASAGFAAQLMPDVDLIVDYTAVLGRSARLTWVTPAGSSSAKTQVMGHAVQVGIRVNF